MKNNLPFDSVRLAAYVLKRCRVLGIEGVNATKIQKLMYCCCGAVLAVCRFRLCSESPEAWRYGPAFPRTLRLIRAAGLAELSMVPCEDIEVSLDDELGSLIDQTLAFFGQYPAENLASWPILPGSPWHQASDGGRRLYEQIGDAVIKDYFERRVVWMDDRTSIGEHG